MLFFCQTLLFSAAVRFVFAKVCFKIWKKSFLTHDLSIYENAQIIMIISILFRNEDSRITDSRITEAILSGFRPSSRTKRPPQIQLNVSR